MVVIKLSSCLIVPLASRVSPNVSSKYLQRHFTGWNDLISNLERLLIDLSFLQYKAPGLRWLDLHTSPVDNVLDFFKCPSSLYYGLRADCHIVHRDPGRGCLTPALIHGYSAHLLHRLHVEVHGCREQDYRDCTSRNDPDLQTLPCNRESLLQAVESNRSATIVCSLFLLGANCLFLLHIFA